MNLILVEGQAYVSIVCLKLVIKCVSLDKSCAGIYCAGAFTVVRPTHRFLCLYLYSATIAAPASRTQLLESATPLHGNRSAGNRILVS